MPSTLPSPPLSSEDKENRPPTTTESKSSPRKAIEWASTKEVFSYAPVSRRSLELPNVPRKPRKSILKPSRPSLPCAPEKKRDETPLPNDALENAQYLEYPVSVIIGEESTLRELTEAYSILTARIRQAIPQSFFSSPNRATRHALFDPLRREAEVLSSCIARDLGRIFVDPFVPPNSPPSTPTKDKKSILPTPQDSPASKKGGMNEEQVKYARDLSTVASATIRFLTLALQIPAIYNVFTTKQLNSILTALLAIPLAESIRSPTARKICGFAMTALQTQRLPDSILTNAAPRIAFALKRAIEGELGREGKKGATAEAFRAVHDLSIYRPVIFIPILHIYLTTLLESLLTPSNVLRVLAAHALGGFVLGLIQAKDDFEDVLLEISPVVSEFFLRKTPQENSQTTILRTLRTALRNAEPSHHAQGPFWATSVLASLTVLLGPALLRERQLLVEYRATIDIGLKARKRIVRAIISTIWGPLIWVWQRWRASVNEVSVDSDDQSEDASEQEKVKKCFSAMLRMTVHLPVGIAFIGALLGEHHDNCRQDDLHFALFQLGMSARQGGESAQRALELLDRLVNSREDEGFYEHWTENFLEKLVPSSLLSVSPGLLTVDISVVALSPVVESIVAVQPSPVDVRPLADEEKCAPGVWTRIKDAWILCIEQLEMSENDSAPDALLDIWTGLIRMGLINAEGKYDSSLLTEYASQCAEVLISIFTNESIDLRERLDDAKFASTSSVKTLAECDVSAAANMRLKLRLVRALWTAMVDILPASSTGGAWKPMIKFLVRHQDVLVPSSEEESDDENEALSEWSQFCAQVAALASSPEITNLIWEHTWEWDTKMRARAWRGYTRGWVDGAKGSWREATGILGLPFRVDSPWDMSGADLSAWSSLLAYAVEMAARDHVDAPEVLEIVVSHIDQQRITSLSSALRVADCLFEMLKRHIENCSELPLDVIDLVHEVLLTSYPPEPRNKVDANWLLRSVQSCISNCPANLIIELLERLHDGLCAWFSDECALFSSEEYSREIIPLFQTLLIALEPLPPSPRILQSFSALFASALQTDPDTRELSSDRAEALSAFTDFWNNNCLSFEAPCGRWSDGILHALGLAFPTTLLENSSECETIESGHLEVQGLADELIASDEEDELDVLPRTTTPRRHPNTQIPLPASYANHDASILPPTPKKSTKYSQFPDGPRLPGLFSSLSPPKDASRVKSWNPSQRSRTASNSTTGSDDTEKENISPRKTGIGMVHSGTKRGSIDPDCSPSSAKRLRTQTFGSDDSEDARTVEAVLHVGDTLHAAERLPFGSVNVNANLVQTPTKRTRTRIAPSLGIMDISQCTRVNKIQKARDNVKATRSARRLAAADDDDTDDGEYLPSSSELESEEEDNGPSSSSSPIGPSTPRAARQAEYAIAITQDPASDDVVTSSSPTRNIRRMARAERLSSNSKMYGRKTNAPAPPSRYLTWSMAN
ncbi:hypothetical protein ACEPAF_9967 [Sanghuangporus sanghuang]